LGRRQLVDRDLAFHGKVGDVVPLSGDESNGWLVHVGGMVCPCCGD
jgi:hypothetical protein